MLGTVGDPTSSMPEPFGPESPVDPAVTVIPDLFPSLLGEGEALPVVPTDGDELAPASLEGSG